MSFLTSAGQTGRAGRQKKNTRTYTFQSEEQRREFLEVLGRFQQVFVTTCIRSRCYVLTLLVLDYPCALPPPLLSSSVFSSRALLPFSCLPCSVIARGPGAGGLSQAWLHSTPTAGPPLLAPLSPVPASLCLLRPLPVAPPLAALFDGRRNG